MSLSVESLDVAFVSGRTTGYAVRDVTTSFRAGAVTLVNGPSGSGKTSLLSCLGCLLQPSRGEVRSAGRRLTALSDHDRACWRLATCGFVFQNFRLFPALDVSGNIALPLRLRGVSAALSAPSVADALEWVGLSHLASSQVAALSGGEQQRVAIARALVGRPAVVLADEPTAALDAENGRAIGALLRKAAEDRGATVVVVTHDDRLLPIADDVKTMRDGYLEESR